MTDAVITDLASISALRVISRQSVMRYKRSDESMPAIARALGVDALIQGTVVRSDGRVRLTVQLVHGRSDRHLWAASYDRDFVNVLALQGDLAQAVAQAVRVRLTEQEQLAFARRPQVDPEAYYLFLRGRQFWERRSFEAINTSIDLYKKSIDQDPSFAAPYGAMALSYLLLANYKEADENYVLAKAAADKALARDAELADALIATGTLKLYQDWDWAGSLRIFERVVARNPNYVVPQLWYGTLLESRGRRDEALARRRLAVALDPLSQIAHLALGESMLLRGRYVDAVGPFRRALELDPKYANARTWLGWTLVALGKKDEGIAEAEEGVKLSGSDAQLTARLANAYALAGRHADARTLLHRLQEKARRQYVRPVHFAQVHTGLGERDRAFEWLENARRAHEPGATRIRSDVLLVPLYNDPRFAQFARRINLPDP